ncbi:hypothetical protein ACFUIW_12995 [Streptomyces sp. NPDC057245]|uniref:hypothetical protein n=1 Tax=Streptomyces TaxID=1883 RepID=UPI001C1E0B12|nr:hypothetical protein [Streptomyces sp. A108]MBU6529810.1 hypothetical protein [Streptomyces sp. A108]
MSKKDELPQRRYRALVAHLEDLMRAGLKPEYEGYYGTLVLTGNDRAELGDLDAIRRAAREAGRRLGWEPTTKFVGDRLFVVDEWDVPEEICKRASGDTADRMDERRQPAPRPPDEG